MLKRAKRMNSLLALMLVLLMMMQGFSPAIIHADNIEATEVEVTPEVTIEPEMTPELEVTNEEEAAKDLEDTSSLKGTVSPEEVVAAEATFDSKEVAGNPAAPDDEAAVQEPADIGAASFSLFSLGDVRVKASSLQSIFPTFTDPATLVPPPQLRISLAVDIMTEGTTNMWIEIPENCLPTADFDHTPTAAMENEPFFSFDEPASLPGPGTNQYVDYYDTSENGKLRIKLKDNLAAGQSTINLYYDFNSGYDAIVPEDTTLWNVEAKVLEGTTPIYTDNVLRIATAAEGASASRMYTDFRRTVPTNDVYTGGSSTTGEILKY